MKTIKVPVRVLTPGEQTVVRYDNGGHGPLVNSGNEHPIQVAGRCKPVLTKEEYQWAEAALRDVASFVRNYVQRNPCTISLRKMRDDVMDKIEEVMTWYGPTE